MTLAENTESTGERRSPAVGTIQDLIGILCREHGDAHPPRAALEALAERASLLGRRATERLEELGAPARRRLAEVAGRGRGEFDARELRELWRAIRSLRCLVGHLFRGEDSLAPDELALRYHQTDLSEMTRSVCAAFEGLAAEREIRYEVSVPHRVGAQVDPGKVELVLLNLLFNAFKYTPRAGAVEVLLVEDRRSEALALTVADSGPGIPWHQSEAIFDRVRLIDRSVSTTIDGLGFDLGTSRDFASLHGGTLVLGRPAGKGAAFRLTLPRRAPPGTRVSTEGRSSNRLAERVAERAREELGIEAEIDTAPVALGERPLVLIVEDDRSLQRVLTECLKGDYETVSALNGEEGFQKAVELSPDLVITDIAMPRMDGATMVRSLRKRPGLSEVPVLVVAAMDDPMEVVSLLGEIAQDVLRKPFLLPEVRARVQNLLSSRQASALLRDLVDRRETDLVRLAAEVSRKQHALERALEEGRAARERAERTSRIKSNFLRMMSHELKTPIAALQLHLGLLERDRQVSSSPALREGLRRVSRSSRRLVHLVDTLLEWARVESGRCQLSVEEMELSSLAREVVEELRERAERKGLAIELAAPAGSARRITSDHRLVRLLVLNLVERAIQHTERGAISVSTDFAEGRHRVRVRDDGPPISSESSEDLFAALDPSMDIRVGSGSGIGLYVMRDLARAVDGDVEFLPDEEPGNTLLLSLPDLPVGRTKARTYVPPPERGGSR